MAQHGRSGQHTPRSRALAAGLASAALVASACTGTAKAATGAARPAAPPTSVVVVGKVIGGGPVLDNETTTFAVDGGAVHVLVPVGAVTKGSTVQVREVTGVPADLGAVQRGGKAYDLAISGGRILPNRQIAVQFTLPTPLPAGDPDPVGGRWDESAAVWRAVTSDAPDAGAVTVFAPTPGTYSWLHWSWDRAVATGADAVRTVVGPRQPTDGAPACRDGEAVRARLDVSGTARGGVTWCVGREGGDDVIRLRNGGTRPLTVRHRGPASVASTNADALAAELTVAARPVWAPPDGEGVQLIEPGEETTFRLAGADADAAAQLRVELDGFTQHHDALHAAVAFAAGLYAGSSTLAAALLQDEPAVRAALVGRLAGPGCVNGLGDRVGGGTYTLEQLAAYAALLVRRCVDADTVRLVVAAVARTAAGNLRSSFSGAVPTSAEQQIEPALLDALRPLVTPAGDAPAGEITVTAKGPAGAAPAPPLASAGTAPAVTPTVAPIVPPTVAPAAAPPTTGGPAAPTTAAQTPAVPPTPAPTPTAAPGAAAPTTGAPPPLPPTTRPPAVTPAPTAPPVTLATDPPTTAAGTVATSPPGALRFSVASAPCGLNGGRLVGSSGNFAPGWRWTATYTSPSGAPVAASGTGGTVEANGTVGWSFACSGAPEPGPYRVEIAERCPDGTPCAPRAPVSATFFVNTYDTRWATDRGYLPVCSGGTDLGSPGGSASQRFVVGGTTIGQLGVTNTERFTGTVSILRGGTTLFSRAVTVNGEPEIRVGGIGLSGLTPGEVLVLRIAVTAATAPANHAVNFTQSTSGGAAPGSSIQVTTANSCPWTLPIAGLGQGIPAPAPGADLIAWIAPAA